MNSNEPTIRTVEDVEGHHMRITDGSTELGSHARITADEDVEGHFRHLDSEPSSTQQDEDVEGHSHARIADEDDVDGPEMSRI